MADFKYRKKHAAGDKLVYVFLWVRQDAGAAEKGTSAPLGTIIWSGSASAAPLGTIIWDGPTEYLEMIAGVVDIKGAKASGMKLVTHQMPPDTRRKDAIEWIDSPDGIAWSQGQPAALIAMKVDGR